MVMSEGSYIRGAGASPVDSRRVGLVAAWAGVALLALCTVFLAVHAASQHSTSDRLRSRGTAVQVTVTGCSGITSGIGFGVEYYDCQGSYLDGGVTRQALIHGSRVERQVGDVVQAVVVPGDPGTLTLASALARSSPTSWAAPLALGAATVVAAGCLAALASRRSRRRKRGTARHANSGAGPSPVGTSSGS